jgi:prepilin-type N-terminal cleavage/methylation domain-containing protein
MRSKRFTRRAAGGRTRARRTDCGMTLIELMVAVVVLAVGLAGVAIMMTTAIASNSRNRLDTGGTMLAQTVMEKIGGVPSTSNGTVSITDCKPGGAQTFTIRTQDNAGPTGAGATMTSTGQIDYTLAASSVTSGYQMTYYTCAGNGRTVPYDVRWNIITGQTLGGKTYTKLVTVAARQVVGGNYQLRLYAPPINLRGYVGQ